MLPLMQRSGHHAAVKGPRGAASLQLKAAARRVCRAPVRSRVVIARAEDELAKPKSSALVGPWRHAAEVPATVSGRRMARTIRPAWHWHALACRRPRSPRQRTGRCSNTTWLWSPTCSRAQSRRNLSSCVRKKSRCRALLAHRTPRTWHCSGGHPCSHACTHQLNSPHGCCVLFRSVDPSMQSPGSTLQPFGCGTGRRSLTQHAQQSTRCARR